MPQYDFMCADCDARREVRADYATKSKLELVCVHCGGVMRAAPSSSITAITAKETKQAKPHTHSHACSSAIKLTRPNPFAKEIERALDGA